MSSETSKGSGEETEKITAYVGNLIFVALIIIFFFLFLVGCIRAGCTVEQHGGVATTVVWYFSH